MTSRVITRRQLLRAGAAAATLAAGSSFPSIAAGSEVIRILYTNDTHARLEPFVENNVSIGGIARRKEVIDRIRWLGGSVILLDAGDVFQGTLYFNVYEGLADQPFINALGYDAMTLGNHEFNKGPAVLARFLSGLRVPVTSSNLGIDPASPLAGLVRPWTIVERGRTRIGIIGVTTDETPILSSPGPQIRFGDHYAGLQGAADWLSSLGVAAKIGLTHIGYAQDRQLAQRTNGIAVIVGGHSHTKVDPTPEVVTNAVGRPVLIVQAQDWGRYVGLLDVELDGRGVPIAYRGALIPVDETVPEDPEFVARLAPFKAGVEAFGQKVVGTAAVTLVGERTAVRSRETNLGNLVADLLLERMAADRAQIALVNGGGIRADIPAGPVTVGRIKEVLPFDNAIMTITITGAQLIAALENGVSQVETGAGRFPQVAGMRFVWDPTRPPNSRIVRVEIGNPRVGWRPVDQSATYRLATVDFLVNGGDGYAVFRAGLSPLNSGLLLSDLLIEHFERVGTVSAAVEGRIQALGRVASLTSSVAAGYEVALDDLWRPGEGLQPISRRLWAV
ncbi:MAG: 5'-nucleotidase C-terminal domain-containing protein [Chloroflexota bacterium]|nr:5'-nucleotidase C-terminal domain-containing protein [Dehalococcoidia bacterium]MDW8255141.1 5'-nucleotidase C-terminal domain-containing protein [Chloroflexota bacterium]